jgi:hypothetical protein
MAEKRAQLEFDDDRTPRTHETRDAESRPDDRWLPPEFLPVPNPQPGWCFRWVRTSTLNKSDNTNVSSKFRQGWQPVKITDHPEIQLASDVGSRFPENIEIGGLLLCKMPEEMVKQRNAHYVKMAAQQIEAVDHHYMKDQDSRMPMFKDRKTRTEFGRG